MSNSSWITQLVNGRTRLLFVKAPTLSWEQGSLLSGCKWTAIVSI